MTVTSDFSLEVLKAAGNPGDPFDAAKRLDVILERAGAAGIDLGDAFREARAHLHRVRDVRRAFENGKPDLDAEAGRLARKLVLGELNFDEAALEASRIEARATGLLQKAVRRTDSAATTLAWRAAGEAIDADTILTEAREVSSRIVGEVLKLRPVLAGVANAEDAATAGPEVAAAWAAYRQHLEAWHAAHDLVALLRVEHWIAPLPVPHQDGRNGDQRRMHLRRGVKAHHGRRYEHPERLADAKRNAKAMEVEFLDLLDPVCDEAQPVPPATVDEEVRWWTRWAQNRE